MAQRAMRTYLTPEASKALNAFKYRLEAGRYAVLQRHVTRPGYWLVLYR